MGTSLAYVTGGAGLFFMLTLTQSFGAPTPVQHTYRYYALFLLCILCYFFIKPWHHIEWTKQSEAVLFSGAVMGYLLFVRALFRGRRSFSFIRDFTQLGLFAVLACLLAEKIMHYLCWTVDIPMVYIKVIDGLLRGFLALLGMFFILAIYRRFPEDRYFSSFLLLGNLFLLLGGLTASIISILPELVAPTDEPARVLSVSYRNTVMQLALLPEILCFFLAIMRRQSQLPSTEPIAISPEPDKPANDEPTPPTSSDQQSQLVPQKPLVISEPKVAFRTSKGFEFIKRSDIILIQGGGNGANFIKVYKKGQDNPIIVNQTLSRTLRLLSMDTPFFQQPHRSYIINVQQICRLYQDEDGVKMAVMDNGLEVPITPDQLPVIRSLLGLE